MSPNSVSARTGQDYFPLPAHVQETHPKPLTDQERWVERVRRGDRATFEELFRTHYSALCRFVCHYVASPDVAEDLVQDVFLNVWDYREKWKPRRSVRAYLYTAARNRALNYLKRRRVEKRWHRWALLHGPTLDTTAEEGLRHRELVVAAQHAIAQLPDRCRAVFLLSRQDQMSYSEIAEALGVSIKTVETQMGRALKQLRISLSEFRT